MDGSRLEITCSRNECMLYCIHSYWFILVLYYIRISLLVGVAELAFV